MNIVERIFQNADRSAPALIEGETTLTYGQLQERVEAASEQLEKSGALNAAGVTARVRCRCHPLEDGLTSALQ